MKKLLSLTACLTSSICISSAATYAVSNGSGATANGIANSTLSAFVGTGASVSIGTFATTTDFSQFTSAASLIAAYSQYGVAGPFLTAGIAGNKGVFSLSTAGTAAGVNFADKPISLLVGNASTYAASTQFLVLNNARNFLGVDDASGTPISVVFTDAALIKLGNAAADIRTTTADASVTPGFTTVALVPEPSAALLGAIGALGLLRRRRN